MANKSYVVAGPTASGKSDFAHVLSKRAGGTIINADSVQIYRGIENISASPLAGGGRRTTNGEIDGVPYRLYSIKNLSEQISVADYLDMARAEFDAADVQVFVGGSGYYISALLNGLSPVPGVSAESRERARRMTAENLPAAQGLAKCDFDDPHRVARALEVFLETDRPLSEWQKMPRSGAIVQAPLKILICPPREVLAERVRARLKIMLDNGGLDEVRANIGFPERAIGIDEIGKYLRGESGLADALENWAVRTMQYAKRQMTWFRNQFRADIVIPRIPTEEDVDLVIGCKL